MTGDIHIMFYYLATSTINNASLSLTPYSFQERDNLTHHDVYFVFFLHMIVPDSFDLDDLLMTYDVIES